MFQVGDACRVGGSIEAVVIGKEANGRLRMLEFKPEGPHEPFEADCAACVRIQSPRSGPVVLCEKSAKCKANLRQHVWPYCSKCMQATWGVDVRRSSVAGFGLFACRSFAKGEVVVPYSASYPQRSSFERLEGKQSYARRLKELRDRNPKGKYQMGTVDDRGHSCFLDSEEWHNYPGRFANDTRNEQTCNVEVFEGKETVTIELACLHQFCLSVDIVAKRDIRENEELFLAYGDEYWLNSLADEHLDFKDTDSMMQSFSKHVHGFDVGCRSWIREHAIAPIACVHTETQLLFRYCRSVVLDCIAEKLCLPSHKTLIFWTQLKKRLCGKGYFGLVCLCRSAKIDFPFSVAVQDNVLAHISSCVWQIQ